VLLGDFGCAFEMKLEDNVVTGCTTYWCKKSFVELLVEETPLSMKDLIDNEVHSLCKTFTETIESVKDIKLSHNENTL